MGAKTKEKAPEPKEKEVKKAEEVAQVGTPASRQNFQMSFEKKLDDAAAKDPKNKTVAAMKAIYDFARGNALDDQATINKKLAGEFGNTKEEKEKNQKQQEGKANAAKDKLDKAREFSTSNWADVGDALKALQAYTEYMQQSGQMSKDPFSMTAGLAKGAMHNDLVQAPWQMAKTAAAPLRMLKAVIDNVKEAKREAAAGKSGEENPKTDPEADKKADDILKGLEEGLDSKIEKAETADAEIDRTLEDTADMRREMFGHDDEEEFTTGDENTQSGPSMGSSG
jgi:hypothetical protein